MNSINKNQHLIESGAALTITGEDGKPITVRLRAASFIAAMVGLLLMGGAPLIGLGDHVEDIASSLGYLIVFATGYLLFNAFNRAAEKAEAVAAES